MDCNIHGDDIMLDEYPSPLSLNNEMKFNQTKLVLNDITLSPSKYKQSPTLVSVDNILSRHASNEMVDKKTINQLSKSCNAEDRENNNQLNRANEQERKPIKLKRHQSASNTASNANDKMMIENEEIKKQVNQYCECKNEIKSPCMETTQSPPLLSYSIPTNDNEDDLIPSDKSNEEFNQNKKDELANTIANQDGRRKWSISSMFSFSSKKQTVSVMGSNPCLRIFVIGGHQSGKSTLLHRFMFDQSPPSEAKMDSSNITQKVLMYSKSLDEEEFTLPKSRKDVLMRRNSSNEALATVQLVETIISKTNSFDNFQGGIMIYDIADLANSKESIQTILKEKSKLDKQLSNMNKIPIILIANKRDRLSEDQLKYASQNLEEISVTGRFAGCFATSAIDGTCVDLALKKLTSLIMNQSSPCIRIENSFSSFAREKNQTKKSWLF